MKYEMKNLFDKDDYGYILMPEKIGDSEKYPVIYMIHGTAGYKGWEKGGVDIKDNMDAWQDAYDFAPLIIVMPSVKHYVGGLGIEDFEKFSRQMPSIVKSVSDYYEDVILTGCENTAIAGFSIGGAAALYTSLLYNELFLHTAAFSPSACINYTDKEGVVRGWLPSADSFVLNNGENSFQYIGYGTNENFMYYSQHYVRLIDDKFEKDHGKEEVKPMNRYFLNNNGTRVCGGAHNYATFIELMRRYFAGNIFGEHNEYQK